LNVPLRCSQCFFFIVTPLATLHISSVVGAVHYKFIHVYIIPSNDLLVKSIGSNSNSVAYVIIINI